MAGAAGIVLAAQLVGSRGDLVNNVSLRLPRRRRCRSPAPDKVNHAVCLCASSTSSTASSSSSSSSAAEGWDASSLPSPSTSGSLASSRPSPSRKAAAAAAAAAAEQDTLGLLEWSRVCARVASFCATRLGREMAERLRVGGSREESEALLRETRAVVELEARLGRSFEFGGVSSHMVSDALSRAARGQVMTSPELHALAMMLVAARKTRVMVISAANELIDIADVLLPVIEMVADMSTHPDLSKLIIALIDEDGIMRDNASQDLKRARMQLQSAESNCRQLLQSMSSRLAGSPEICDRGGRLCLMVTAEGRNAAPGLLLDSGAGGSVFYVEPSGAVPLNNRVSEARELAAQAEEAVCLRLTNKVRDVIDDVTAVLDTLTSLDVVVARARYASWLEASCPQFTTVSTSGFNIINTNDNNNADSASAWQVHLLRLRHPLLIEQQREEKKRRAQAAKDSLLQQKGQAISAKGINAASVASRKRSSNSNSSSSSSDGAGGSATLVGTDDDGVVPIDVYISNQTRVVIITGPNTGGKTAALKAIGLAALMAKAGLFVPAKQPAILPWFDAVYADIGDGQSLTQNLSTFSGHLRRIQRIKSAATRQSLVLLDEVGAGTDPVEGAALGAAVLRAFAQGGARLTLASTHHGELKALKYNDERFENASVEFDEEKLAPTYRLLWGIPGRSNALNIAFRLGLSEAIVADARERFGQARTEVNEMITAIENHRRQYEQYTAQTSAMQQESSRMQQELAVSRRRLREHAAVVRRQQKEAISALATEARAALAAETRRAQSTGTRRKQQQGVKLEEAVKEVEVNLETGKPQQTDGTNLAYVPEVGDTVQVLQTMGKVVSVSAQRQEAVVQMGLMQLKVAFNDLAPPGSTQKQGSSSVNNSSAKAINKRSPSGRMQMLEQQKQAHAKGGSK